MKKILLTLIALVAFNVALDAAVKGDVNGDGLVSSVDITALYNWLLNSDASAIFNGDVDGDGVISSVDITIIYNILLGNDTPTETEYTVNGVKFKMVDVEGGTFTMGVSGNSYMPAHQVTLSSFAISQTEVTQALWKAVMGSNPSYYIGNLNLPVENVSWNDCIAFIVKLNQMLPIYGYEFAMPTEAQWEFAARGGNKSHDYRYSGSDAINDVAWYKNNSGGSTHVVMGKAPNELGLYDMSGNVAEWCADREAAYPTEPQTNPTGPTTGTNRILRGGTYNTVANSCQVTSRDYWNLGNKDKDLGLRIVLVPNLEQQLIGEWTATEHGVQYNYIYNSDHTLIMKTYKNGVLNEELNGTWSLDGNILTMTVSVNGQSDTLIVEISIEGDVLHIMSDGEVFDLHRVIPYDFEQQLIGEWVFINSGSGLEVHFLFNADHTGKYTKLLAENIQNETLFTWSLNGNILSMTTSEGIQTAEIFIEGNILYMTIEGETAALHRVK